jgi:hypothetical protein
LTLRIKEINIKVPTNSAANTLPWKWPIPGCKIAMFLANSSSQSIAENTISTPITAPMYYEIIMAIIDHGLYFVLVDCLMATANVTAGLKCVPQTGDKKITNA